MWGGATNSNLDVTTSCRLVTHFNKHVRLGVRGGGGFTGEGRLMVDSTFLMFAIVVASVYKYILLFVFFNAVIGK